MTISFTVNGTACEVEDARGTDRLIDYLHDDLNRTGTKFGCGIGLCRACTVAVSKGPNPIPFPVVACSTALSSINGADILTIEGMGDANNLAPIQEAFLKHFSFQCGYCTPGFVMASHILLTQLAAQPVPEEQLDDRIRDAIGNHLCRCTGYVRYAEALRETALAVNSGETVQ